MFHSAPIFPIGSGGRICHCATLVELRDGDLLAAWFAGSFETAPDQAIYAAYFQTRPSRWMPPTIIVDTPGHADGQPVLYAHPRGALWLFFVTNAGQDWKTAQLKLTQSFDQVHWDTPRVLNDRPGLMFRSKPLTLPDGSLVLPVYDEIHWQSMAMISADGGKSWRLGQPIVTPAGNIHPCLVSLSDGRLLAFLRTGGEGGWIWQTTSDDGGWTWHEARPTRFPNPNAGIDLIRLHTGHLALAFNDSPRRRTPLCVALSDDEGRTWNARRNLEDGDAEFSYPTLLQTSDGNIHCVYTYRRETIQHVVFDESWLKERIGN
jgi:predicted neuraminidase